MDTNVQLVLTTTNASDNANTGGLIDDLHGIDSHTVEAIHPGGNIDNINNLPQELNFIVNQSYNYHSMMTRAKNGIVKQKTFEDFYCFPAISQQKLYEEYLFLVDSLQLRTFKIL